MNRNSGTETDLFNRYFPGEPWTIEFVPTDAQSDALKRMVEGRAANPDVRATLMQMLGLETSTSAAPTTDIGKRARTSPVQAQRNERSKRQCPQGHPRATHSALDRRGRPYCMTCRAELGERRREEARARKAAA